MTAQKRDQYTGYGQAGIRLKEKLSPLMPQTYSPEEELARLYAFHMFDKAHLVMMAEQNMISREEAAKMLLALREMEKKGIEKTRLEVGKGAYAGYHSGEHYLISKFGEDTGGKIGLARGAADISQAGIRIKLRDDSLQIMELLNKLRGAFLGVAGKHLDTIMPNYTHLQHSQPTTLAHYLVAYASSHKRDFERFEQLYHRVNMSPAGSIITTGTNFPIDRLRMGELLGFEKTLRNTNDCIFTHDTSLEAMSVLAIMYNNLAKWAQDIQIWCINEIGIIDFPDRFCNTSSVEPQKKNPWICEHIKGAAAYTQGGLATMYIAYKGPKGLPVADRMNAMNTFWASLGHAVHDLTCMVEILPEIKVNKGLMRERAGAFWAQSTDLAAALVKEKGLSWRTAHQIVSILVRLGYERGVKPQDVDSKFLDEAAKEYTGKSVGLSEESLKKALDPVEFVRGRTLYGGTNPDEVREQIAELEGKCKQDKATVADLRAFLKEAAEKLDKAVDAIVGA